MTQKEIAAKIRLALSLENIEVNYIYFIEKNEDKKFSVCILGLICVGIYGDAEKAYEAYFADEEHFYEDFTANLAGISRTEVELIEYNFQYVKNDLLQRGENDIYIKAVQYILDKLEAEKYNFS